MKDKVKLLIKKYLVHFSYFYSHLGYRVFIALCLSLMVGVLDGFGLAMFIPLLKMVEGDSNQASEDLGGMGFLVNGLENMGIGLTLISVLLIISIFFIMKGVFKFCESYYTILNKQYFIKKLRYDNVEKLSEYSYRAFVTADSGKIQNTLSAEVNRVSNAYSNYFSAVQAGVLVSVYAALAFMTNAQFAVLVVIGGGLSNLLYYRIYRKTKETSSKVTKGGHVFQGLLIQMVSFFKYLKATGSIDNYGNKLKGSIDYIENSNKKIGFYDSILLATREPIVISVVVVVIFIQVNLFSEKIGVIVLSLLFFYRSLNSLVYMQGHWNKFLNNSGALENMREFMSDLERNKEPVGKHVFSGLRESIVLDRLSFAYGSNIVLNEISLEIKKNKVYAFVGESGSGKTTLVNIIAGLFPLTSGAISVDGIAYNDLEKKSFSKKIGYISQEPVIFSDSVFNNVTLWADPNENNIARFWEAIEKAALYGFIKELKERENSQLGSNGVMVSGGQKQRISIARELYKEVDVLILDEATSALDSETERIIQESFDRLKGHYTLLIVAHRLSTIKNADEVIILDSGKIGGKGNYQTLIEDSLSFRRMVELQEI